MYIDTMNKVSFSISAVIVITALVFVGIYGEMKGHSDASQSADSIRSETKDSDISALMASLNMHQLQEPVEAPDFNLLSVSEEDIKLSEHRGNVVLLSFWATW
jgi:hypothetical protein